ncbi:hypothetical protein JCM19233_4783 [Vibrio astriarenae]|nr:hypothetical protein JCM19233_4783 [Vibrio sp. C7]
MLEIDQTILAYASAQLADDLGRYTYHDQKGWSARQTIPK